MSGRPSDLRLFVLGGLAIVVAVFVLVLVGRPSGAPRGLRSGASPGQPGEPGELVQPGQAGESGQPGQAGQAGESDQPGQPGEAADSGQSGQPGAGQAAPEPAGAEVVSGSAGSAATRQENPETADPGLRREHERLLRQRPVFQHLPYRDREIGVDFDRVLIGGRLELLVTYLGSRAGAVADVHRLLSRYGDPGTAYVMRYERVF
ncbi:MAG TPA: collagen-like protein [Solirubrobacteraceae bacterium]|nr:collagen-like protein [Solirubrobacteraceae bacterium]